MQDYCNGEATGPHNATVSTVWSQPQAVSQPAQDNNKSLITDQRSSHVTLEGVEKGENEDAEAENEESSDIFLV